VAALGTLLATIAKQHYLKSLFDFLKNQKDYSIIIFIVVLIVVIMFLTFKIFSTKIDLRNHKFFSQMDFYIGYNICNLKKELSKNRIAFADYLILKFEFWKAHSSFLVEEYYNGNIKDNNYYKKWFMDALKEQQIIMDKNNIPVIVCNIINRWHNRRIKSTLNFISKISQSNNRNKNIINSLLIYLDNVFDDTISDAETSIYTLNGDLKGEEYHRIIDNNNEIIKF